MKRKAWFVLAALVVLGIVVFGVYWYAPGQKLPLTRTALDTKVTLNSVTEEPFGVEIVENKPDWDLMGQRDYTGPIEVRPGSAREDHEVSLSDGSALETYTIRVPRFIRRVAISKQVISYEGAVFRFPPFDAKDLPITKRIGKLRVTVRKFYVDKHGPSNVFHGHPGIVVEFEITRGYMAGNVRVYDRPGRQLTDSTCLHFGARHGVERLKWFCYLSGRKTPPPKISLELGVGRQKTAWVTFRNVPISR